MTVNKKQNMKQETTNKSSADYKSRQTSHPEIQSRDLSAYSDWPLCPHARGVTLKRKDIHYPENPDRSRLSQSPLDPQRHSDKNTRLKDNRSPLTQTGEQKPDTPT